MKKIAFIALTLLVTAVSAEAKSWKVGPSSVVGMDFASINDAMSKVTNGDTLYLDQYYNENAEQTVTKRVVIIGTGYDTSFTDEQVVARLTGNLNLKASKSEVKSVCLKNVYLYSSDCTIERCYANYIGAASEISGINHIYSNYIEGRIVGYNSSQYTTKLDIQNCVIAENSIENNVISNLISSIINNNIIYKHFSHYYTPNGYCLSGIKNSQITNNIIHGYNEGFQNNNRTREFTEDVTSSGSGNSIEHNVFCGDALYYYPTNKSGFIDRWESLFTNEGNYSAKFELAKDIDDNPAVGYATDGGDCGCHGGMFGCSPGGRPQYIPYFTKVTVGSRAEDGKLPVSVTIKIQND